MSVLHDDLDCPVLTVGGSPDHVHILCLLSKKKSLADFVGEVKRSSSKWVKTKGPSLRKFGWQNGYLLSLSASPMWKKSAHTSERKRHIISAKPFRMS